MRSHRSRIASAERHRQILTVATRLFARHGYRGTATRQIAERAGVNEAILFRHFSSKEKLYWAVLEEQCRVRGLQQQLEAELRSGGETRKILVRVAEGILRRNTEDPALPRLLLFSALESHRLSHRFFRTHVARYYEALAGHIRKAIRAGEFRAMDPLLAARSFLGMVSYHFQIQELFGGHKYHHWEIHKASVSLVDLWLEGVRAAHRSERERRGIQSGRKRSWGERRVYAR